MSYKRTAGAGALLQRRSEWVASLKSRLPPFIESTASSLEHSGKTGVFSGSERHVLDDAVKASLLVLPAGWQDEATRCLSRTLHGVVEPQTLRQCDFFLCSLLHPTYARASTVRCDNEAKRCKLQQQLRCSVCMPLELTAAGSKSLCLIRELNHYVEGGAKGQRPSRQRESGPATASSFFRLNAPWPVLQTADTRAFLRFFSQSGLTSLVLFDEHVFPPTPVKDDAESRATVPGEAVFAAVTALCGSIELVCGWASLLQFVDRVARDQSGG
jgi:hypothetical protein